MNYADRYPKIESLVGKTFTKVEDEGDNLVFTLENGDKYSFYHDQDCCENVSIESIVGDLHDLVGTPLLVAEESSSNCESASESGTWTFYKFATVKGWVDVRWIGESNGYYSEGVDLHFEEKK